MKITRLACRDFEFEAELTEMDLQQAPVVALTCPRCGKSTAIQRRPGAGIEVALDKLLEKERK